MSLPAAARVWVLPARSVAKALSEYTSRDRSQRNEKVCAAEPVRCQARGRRLTRRPRPSLIRMVTLARSLRALATKDLSVGFVPRRAPAGFTRVTGPTSSPVVEVQVAPPSSARATPHAHTGHSLAEEYH